MLSVISAKGLITKDDVTVLVGTKGIQKVKFDRPKLTLEDEQEWRNHRSTDLASLFSPREDPSPEDRFVEDSQAYDYIMDAVPPKRLGAAIINVFARLHEYSGLQYTSAAMSRTHDVDVALNEDGTMALDPLREVDGDALYQV
uniref:Vacuolar protein sorting-associated protein 35 n=1 Tax=Lygus hesperus TaxID=30085 RepID=A0A0A9W6D1_LYGHE